MVVGDEGQVASPLLRRPTDPPISGGTLPSRRAKEQAGQILSGVTPNQVAEVLAHWAAIAQIVILGQILSEYGIVRLLRANDLNPQRSQRGQVRDNGFAGRFIKQLGAELNATGWGQPPPLWQPDESSLLQFQQQRPSGHVFELTRSGIPFPSLGQDPRQSPATPKRVRLDQRLDLCDLGTTNFAALNDLDFQHAANLLSALAEVPYKIKNLQDLILGTSFASFGPEWLLF